MAWEACRRLYGAKSDLDALESAIRRGDTACVNVYLNQFETILLLGHPDDVLREGDRLLLRYGDQYVELTTEEREKEDSVTRRAMLRIITSKEKRVEL
jgi:tRNA threonylcarbamoyladenosine modification (KEOPS) complex Cgi121 subunit